MNMCANLRILNPADNQTYYWGLLFKPEEPVVEKIWDGLSFMTVFNKATINSTQHVTEDCWVDQRNASKTSDVNSTAYEVNGLPNVPYYGGKLGPYHDKQNDWILAKLYNWIYCNTSTSICEFQACADRKFRTNDPQDWQLNSAFMQNFSAYGFYTTYNTNATLGFFNETRGTIQGFSKLLYIQLSASSLVATVSTSVLALLLLQ